ncbi:MAG: ArnT family glycosyltransferase, partial [Candidatus Syntropharchaeia archaeon]
MKVSNYYPPFFHLSSIPLYFLFGFSEDVAIATNLIFYAVLVFSVFKIGEIFKDKETGSLAAILVSFYPLLLILQREYMLDFALTAMCALALLLLLKSDCFRNPLISAIFGITFGLCELTKWSAFVFILPAIFAVFVIEFKKILDVCAQCGKELGDKFVKKGLYRFCSKKCARIFSKSPKTITSRIISSISGVQITNIIVAFILAFFVLGWWYIPNWEEVSIRLQYFSTIRGAKEGDPTIFTLAGWFYYIKALDVSMGLLFFVLALFSLIFLLKRKDKSAVFFFISIVIPYLILTAMSNKGDRYILPILPVLAVSTAIFLRELPRYSLRGVEGIKLQRLLLAAILVVGMMQLLTVTVGYPKIENSLLYPKPVAPDTADWKIDELLSAINQNGGGAVVVLPDHPYLNGQSL